jgi:farnesyl diphosphate synthase
VLDVEGSAASLGKTAGKDVAQGSRRSSHASGLRGQGARRSAARGSEVALAPLGTQARRLGELADWIVLRAH